MNEFYGKARQRSTAGGLGWLTGNIKALLVTAAYSPSIDVDEFVADIPSGAILKRSSNFTSKTNTLGVLGADTILFPLVAAGNVGFYVVIYRDTGADGTSELIAKDDTGQNFPVTTDGNDISCQWSSGPNKIGQI